MIALTLALAAAAAYLRAHRQARIALLHPVELRPDEFDQAPGKYDISRQKMEFPFKKK